MNISETLRDDILDLVTIGEKLTQVAQGSGRSLEGNYITEAATWVSRIGQMIRRLYPPTNQHLINYEKCIKEYKFSIMHSNYYGHVATVTGIIKAVKHEVERGLLLDVRQLLRADIFADFLEMAEYLLKENYKDASAVIIGSVLEDSLRKLAEVNGISIVSSTGKKLTIDPLNSELAKASIYDRLIQKQITSWADLRNKAAHGKYDEYDKKQVEMMLLFSQNFCAQYLSGVSK